MVSPCRILLPIDVAQCPLEVFASVNKFARDHRTTLELLHVLGATGAQVGGGERAAAAARGHLERLSQKFFSPALEPRLRVRAGNPAGEIVAEAEESGAELILLTSYRGSSLWKPPVHPGIAERVRGAVDCAVRILQVRTRFNCEQQWEQLDEIVAALDYVGLLRPAGL
jgi:nucleotide-binding universal stress UspA family protein